MIAVLDAGALIAIDRRDRRVAALLRVLQSNGTEVHTSAGAVAQVWRSGSRQVNLGRVLSGLGTVALDETAATKVGELLSANCTSDVVDAHIALLVDTGDTVLTSDEADIRALLRTRRVKASVVRV
ncbi:MAG: hypothetical protein ACRDX8_12960 [Acidimicrobiales bacterium]